MISQLLMTIYLNELNCYDVMRILTNVDLCSVFLFQISW